jgi:hypothetical protein
VTALEEAKAELSKAAMFCQPRKSYPLTVHALRTAVEAAVELAALVDRVRAAAEATPDTIEGAAPLAAHGERFQNELRTAVKALESAHAVLARVEKSEAPQGEAALSRWLWATSARLNLAVLIEKLSEAAEGG